MSDEHNCGIRTATDTPCRHFGNDATPASSPAQPLPIDSIDHRPISGAGDSIRSGMSGDVTGKK